ncbi:MAG TPA: carboxypeptidase-like regulatory domain-containing protein, partial [Pyrinomonadaceae bacterium]|nr:carboxypeptidase-like regulatory domain-containing protein [Pyrinomonadaceae bacterium]
MKSILQKTVLLIFCLGLLGFTVSAQEKGTGGVRGKVRMPNGDSIANVTVQAKQEGKEISSAKTDRKGEFSLTNLKPGAYDFVFTKDGLTEGVLQRVEVRSGDVIKL